MKDDLFNFLVEDKKKDEVEKKKKEEKHDDDLIDINLKEDKEKK